MNALLDRGRLVETAEKVRARVADRFPGSGLAEVAAGVVAAAQAASERAAEIDPPNRWVRAGQVLVAVLALVAVAVYFQTRAEQKSAGQAALEFVDAAKGSAAVLGAMAVFLFTLETRLKRQRALRAVHELRALAHIIDVHQLAKDPTQIGRGSDSLLVAGKALGADEMRLYLVACTGLLAVASKLGQLYVQDFPDPSAVAAVDQFENLANGLSNKVWQKLMVLDRVAGVPAAGGASAPEPIGVSNGAVVARPSAG